MITKTGFILGTAVGALRPSNLSAEERTAIKGHYGLKDDASLGWRGAGRGTVGGMLGMVGGGMLGGTLGRKFGGFFGGITGSTLGGALGQVAGGYAAGEKYSKGNAQKIIRENRKKLQQQQ